MPAGPWPRPVSYTHLDVYKRQYLHYLRVREWQDLHRELRAVARDLGLVENAAAADPDAIHRALLAGLLSHVGLRDPDKRDYLGARGARFSIQPVSYTHLDVYKRQPLPG